MGRQVTLLCASLLVLDACSRDLSLPAVPPVLPGAVFGRVVVAVPGRAERQPAKGAQIALLGSSLNTTAGEDGRFALPEVNQRVGKLLFRHVEGTRVRQKLISLEDIGAGPNRQVSLGDVLVAENATVRGRALRAELVGAKTGHRGSVVFVPEGPFLTYTADDGSYEFTELPEGAVELGFFRSGYLPVVVPSLSLRGGEKLTLRDLVLEAELNPSPGAILGSLAFAPVLSDASGARAVARADGFVKQGAVSSAGDFQIEGVPAGLYAVDLSRADYTPTTVFNVLVTSGQPTRLSPVVLGKGQPFDAGMPPAPPDAGTADAGVDAGFDAGTCNQNAMCGVARWCDDGVCVAQCNTGSCSNARVCELTTRTCVVPCSAGCDGGSSCDLSINACRSLCDASRPCSPGFVCNPTTSSCETECSTTRPCPTHKSCNSGQCVSLGTCTTDLDCPRENLCTGGNCLARLTAALDGGFDAGVRFACATTCDCRSDESCQFDAGRCQVVAPATLFYFPDAGGDGGSVFNPSGDLPALALAARRPAVIALLADAGANYGAPLDLDEGVTLSGGYVSCGPNRWVRDDSRRTQLSTPTRAVMFKGTVLLPHADVTLRNLEVVARPIVGSFAGTVEVDSAARFTIENVAGVAVPNPLSSNDFAIFRCTGCSDLQLRGVGLLPSANSGNLNAVRLISVSGEVEGVFVDNNTQDAFRGLYVTALRGPLRVLGSRLEALSGSAVEGIRIEDCGSFPFTFSRNVSRWPNGNQTSRAFVVTNCGPATITNNLIDGRGQTVTLGGDPQTGTYGLMVENSNATVSDNSVFFPSAVTGGGAVAYALKGASANIDFHHNLSDGGANLLFSQALRIANVSLGSLDVHDNALGAFGSANSHGVDVGAVTASAGLKIRDNELRVAASSGGQAFGLVSSSGSLLFERNNLQVAACNNTRGVTTNGSGMQVELYENVIQIGAALGGNPGNGSIGLDLQGQGTYSVIGNSVDVRPDPVQPGASMAMVCSSAVTGSFISNILGAGYHTSNLYILGSSGTDCYAQTTHRANYWWHSSPGSLNAGDKIATLYQADAGSFDVNGNIFNPRISPYAIDAGFELSATSLCLDRGQASQRLDASPILLDYLRRPRVVGAAADIGAAEKP